MKKIVFILLFFPLLCEAQNTIYLTLQPIDLGVGVRYDRKVNDYGIYTSVAYGNYYVFPEVTIKNHVRVVVGALYYTKTDGISRFYYGAGVVYSRFDKPSFTIYDLSPKVYMPLTFEVCVNTLIKRKWAVGLRYDFIKNESAIDFGIYFNR